MAHLTIADLASRTKPVAKKWVQKATANSHGQFRRKAEAAGMSTGAYARAHEGSPGLLGKQARLAETLMGLGHKKRLRDNYKRREK